MGVGIRELKMCVEANGHFISLGNGLIFALVLVILVSLDIGFVIPPPLID